MGRVYVHSEADDKAVALTTSPGEKAASLAARAEAALGALGVRVAALALTEAPGGAPIADGDALPACVDLFAVPRGGQGRGTGAAESASAEGAEDAELLKRAQDEFQVRWPLAWRLLACARRRDLCTAQDARLVGWGVVLCDAPIVLGSSATADRSRACTFCV